MNISDIQNNPVNKPLFVAELGTSHQGDIEKAEIMIRAAKKAGADYAKFQIVFSEEIIHPQSGNIELPGGSTPLFEVFSALERPFSFYEKLREICRANDIGFQCSIFGSRSLRLLHELSPDSIKIASPELNHIPLIEQINQLPGDIPVILSTGVSTLADIDEIHNILKKPHLFLHCITQYPAPEKEYNLHLLPLLNRITGVLWGVSDHSRDPLLVPGTAVYCGAAIIEKHFTLSNNDSGLDDPIAINPDDFRRMTQFCSQLSGLSQQEQWNLLTNQFPEDRIIKVLGSGVKQLAPAEQENYRTTNRSIISIKEIQKGESFTVNNIAVLRSEKNIIPGLHPRYFSTILGKQAVKPVKNGRGICWDDLLHENYSG